VGSFCFLQTGIFTGKTWALGAQGPTWSWTWNLISWPSSLLPLSIRVSFKRFVFNTSFFSSWAWWLTAVIPVTLEAEAEKFRPAQAKLARPYLQTNDNKGRGACMAPVAVHLPSTEGPRINSHYPSQNRKLPFL
jgi:hypothetical protein